MDGGGGWFFVLEGAMANTLSVERQEKTKQETAVPVAREDGMTFRNANRAGDGSDKSVVSERGAHEAGVSGETEYSDVDQEAGRLGRVRITNPDVVPNLLESAMAEADTAAAEGPNVSATTRTLHTVAAAAAAAFSEAGYATADDLKLCMRQNLHATEDRNEFAEALLKFGTECAKKSAVGIAVVSTTKGSAQAWLFEAETGDSSALHAAFAQDASPPSLLLRHVNLQEDYLASHAHGSAIGIDPSSGVSGIRLPDGEEIPRIPLTGGS